MELFTEPTGTFTRYLIVDVDGEVTVGSVAAMIEVIEDSDVDQMPTVAVLDANLNAQAVTVSCLDQYGSTWTIVTADGGHTVENVEFTSNPDTWRIKAREVFVNGWATPHPDGDDY